MKFGLVKFESSEGAMTSLVPSVILLWVATQHGESLEHKGKNLEAGVDAGVAVVVRLDHVVGHWRDCEGRERVERQGKVWQG